MSTDRQTAPDWIALECGTGHVQGWAMQGGQVLDKAQVSVGGIDPDGFAPAIEAVLSGWEVQAQTPLIACGMTVAGPDGAKPAYTSLPCPPLGGPLRQLSIGQHTLWIIPGLCQSTPPDVMCAEETRIAGFLSLNPGWDGVICLPGPQTKWAQVSAGEVVSFQSFLTGELFDLLAAQSVLRHSVNTRDWDDAAFLAAMEDAMGKPERLAARLFAIRADDLLQAAPPAAGRARLMGQLIGAELAAARPYWLGMSIAIIGTAAIARPYVQALQSLGAPATVADGERMALAGLCAAHRQLNEAT